MDLTQEEMDIIMNGIDTYDYSHMGYPRYLDLDSVIKLVVQAKKTHPEKRLKAVEFAMSEERYPPNNYYNIVME